MLILYIFTEHKYKPNKTIVWSKVITQIEIKIIPKFICHAMSSRIPNIKIKMAMYTKSKKWASVPIEHI